MKYIGYFSSVLSDKGVPILATVTVYLLNSSTKATIYTTPAATSEKDNPYQTDSLGRFQFFAECGQYDIEVSGAGITNFKIENVFMDLPYSWLDIVCFNGDVATHEDEVVFNPSF